MGEWHEGVWYVTIVIYLLDVCRLAGLPTHAECKVLLKHTLLCLFVSVQARGAHGPGWMGSVVHIPGRLHR
jgi:hypothetical protein